MAHEDDGHGQDLYELGESMRAEDARNEKLKKPLLAEISALKAQIEAGSDELARLLEQVDWQPIQTAPQDGSWVIIGKHGWRICPKAKWDTIECDGVFFSGWRFEDDELEIGVAQGALGFWEDAEAGDMPTHWRRPIDAPPKLEDSTTELFEEVED